jgi:sec-independent protein translocase protein TatA
VIAVLAIHNSGGGAALVGEAADSPGTMRPDFSNTGGRSPVEIDSGVSTTGFGFLHDLLVRRERARAGMALRNANQAHESEADEARHDQGNERQSASRYRHTGDTLAKAVEFPGPARDTGYMRRRVRRVRPWPGRRLHSRNKEVAALNLGWPEILLIVAVVVLLFGARKLPDLARSMGASAKEFRKGLEEGAADDDADTSD